MSSPASPRTVAVGGLGAIGLTVARALDRDPRGLDLVAVTANDRAGAQSKVAGFRKPPRVVDPAQLADADIVVEAAPAAAFEAIALPAIDRGCTLIVASVGALIQRLHLIDRARATGACIIVPTGALAGLDAIRALALDNISTLTLETRKRPQGLAGAPYLERQGIDVTAIREATCIFRGNALEAAVGFPANANVAAALALAGIGPERTRVEIWADPTVTGNMHTIRIEADAARITVSVESVPSPDNPRTSRLAPLSILACLHSLSSTLRAGS
ncbi:aspartate dehydrogenase [Steroidobacter sp.]|uniref:aspartate dehydrogenase n=1 Tax=Steroidobacter sp. TaxID=1978227 RepID=UPI0025D56116|nr:aspartate dehydrogenase [Steroidobacter sp.]